MKRRAVLQKQRSPHGQARRYLQNRRRSRAGRSQRQGSDRQRGIARVGTTVPEGMLTASAGPGTPAGDQFEATLQSPTAPPVQVIAAARADAAKASAHTVRHRRLTSPTSRPPARS